MKTEIFIIIEGEYSSQEVVAAFSTVDKVAQFLSNYGPTLLDGCHTKGKVEKAIIDGEEYTFSDYTVKRLIVDEVELSKAGFVLHMLKDGRVEFAQRKIIALEQNGEVSFDEDSMWLWCYADDEKHAIKIANEKRVQFIANNTWGINPK